jgi:hypothetical protein
MRRAMDAVAQAAQRGRGASRNVVPPLFLASDTIATWRSGVIRMPSPVNVIHIENLVPLAA